MYFFLGHRYKKFNLNAFRQDMNNAPFEKIKSISKDANEMWILWKAFFLDILHKHAPIINIKVKGNNIPYVTSELKGMIRQRKGLKQTKQVLVSSGKLNITK